MTDNAARIFNLDVYMPGMKAASNTLVSVFEQGIRFQANTLNFCRYSVDLAQRTVLMSDVLRQRGNQYFEYNDAGLPPITPFPYEVILDGRTFERPVNRILVRVKDRRRAEDDLKYKERRTFGSGGRVDWEEQTKRPIIFQDPDASRGLISASRNTSEIGLAIDMGHPTFIILIQPETIKTQTMDDLVASTRIFLKKVEAICAHAKPPAFICNCQAGWQIALPAAQEPGLEGPIIPVGAPMSYWSRGENRHSLRYLGGLTLGSWLPLFLGDLGNDILDAYPPLNFELFDIDRHPVLDLFKWLQQVDDQKKLRVFLTQQKWVYGFHQLSARQFYWIAKELFIQNKLERGRIQLNGKPVDMKRIQNAIILTSYGDTITPVVQGIGWIPRVWSSVPAIKAAGVKLVILNHQQAGHLAIFVSAQVADREHRQIIGSLNEAFDALEPGLYRMHIRSTGDHPPQYISEFEEIDLETIRRMSDDGERPLFHRAAVVSELFDQWYRRTARPWVRAFSNDRTAAFWQQLHPMRFRVSAWADQRNPFTPLIKTSAHWIRSHRFPVGADNPFFQEEKRMRSLLALGLHLFKELRDLCYETSFRLIYDDTNPAMRYLLPKERFADDSLDHAALAAERFPWVFGQMKAPAAIPPSQDEKADHRLPTPLSRSWLSRLMSVEEMEKIWRFFWVPEQPIWRQWQAFFTGKSDKAAFPFPLFADFDPDRWQRYPAIVSGRAFPFLS